SKNREEIRLFEVGKVFESLGKEHWSIAFALSSKKDKFSFRILKWAIIDISRRMGIKGVAFRQDAKDSGRLDIVTGSAMLGSLEVLSKGMSAFAEMDLEKMMALSVSGIKYIPDSPYPSIVRDISLWVSEGTFAEDVMSAIKGVNPENLYDIDLADCFTNGDKLALLFRLTFRSHKKTLVDNEVDKEMDKISEAIKSVKGAEIR
ncbi:MAG: hypothetical protein PHP35_02370, partial [Candidatus Colwellbacteria bacterium]|nr:hypothetical protein [Candidatus Colwellbacteria bacterium]